MSKNPDGRDHKELIRTTAYAFGLARARINKALRLIRDHEDGPMTMAAAIKEIEAALNDAQLDVNTMALWLEDAVIAMGRMAKQRDKTRREFDTLYQPLMATQRDLEEKIYHHC